MNEKKIIMNFSYPPSVEDLEVMANDALEAMPEELQDDCEDIEIVIEELPDETLESDLDLDNPFDLLALYKNGSELTPGVEKKGADADAQLILFRRCILDMWCENGDDINVLIRHIMIEELGRAFEFSDEDIEEMAESHFQGLL